VAVVGERLKEERLLRGWSQRDLAREAGTTAETISSIETGHHEPRPSTLRKLAEGLGIKVRDFYAEPAIPKAEAPPLGPTEGARIANRRRVADVVKAAHDILQNLSRSRAQDREAAALLALMTYTELRDFVADQEALAEVEGESPAGRKAKRELDAAVEAVGETATAIMAGSESKKDPTIAYLKDYRRDREVG
jgi:transcriptional regulator with XRE-family HTH domain